MKKLYLKIFAILLSTSLIMFAECSFLSKDDDGPVTDDRLITRFVFTAEDNDSLVNDIEATITNNGIFMTVPFGAAINSLIPRIEHSGSSVSPASGVPTDFSQKINFMVASKTPANYVKPYKEIPVYVTTQTFNWATINFTELTPNVDNSPRSMTILDGNIYVACLVSNVIKKIDPVTGAQEIFAGSGIDATTDGIRTTANISSPTSVITDGKDLFIAEWNNGNIRKINMETGFVSTLATGFAGIYSITCNSTDIYVSDNADMKIFRVNKSTKIVTDFAGDGVNGRIDGPAASARFNSPRGIYVYGKDLYIGDNRAVRHINLDTKIVSTIASPGSPNSNIMLNGTNLYYSSNDDSRFYSIDLKTEHTLTIEETDTAKRPLQTALGFTGSGPWTVTNKIPAALRGGAAAIPQLWNTGGNSSFDVRIDDDPPVAVLLTADCLSITALVNHLNARFAAAGLNTLEAIQYGADSVQIVKIQESTILRNDITPFGFVFYNNKVYFTDTPNRRILVGQ